MTHVLNRWLLAASVVICAAALVQSTTCIGPSIPDNGGPEVPSRTQQMHPPNEVFERTHLKREGVARELLTGRLTMEQAIDRFHNLNWDQWPDGGAQLLRKGQPQSVPHRELLRIQVLRMAADLLEREPETGPVPAWLKTDLDRWNARQGQGKKRGRPGAVTVARG